MLPIAASTLSWQAILEFAPMLPGIGPTIRVVCTFHVESSLITHAYPGAPRVGVTPEDRFTKNK